MHSLRARNFFTQLRTSLYVLAPLYVCTDLSVCTVDAPLQAFAQLAMHPIGATGEDVFVGVFRRKLNKAQTFGLVLRSMMVRNCPDSSLNVP
jgi:hypothetical protein